LQDQVLPMYYDRAAGGHSPAWIRMAKRSIATILPAFRAGRMLDDYVHKFYAPAAEAHRRFVAREHALARDVARWKEHVRRAWPGVQARRNDMPVGTLPYGQAFTVEVAVALNGLVASDVAVELIVSPSRVGGAVEPERIPLDFRDGPDANGVATWALAYRPERCGGIDYRIRVFPSRPELVHPFETGLLLWL
jgi:starch phosphorylase